jgi:hypothetical protein
MAMLGPYTCLSVEVRAAQIESTLRTLQFASALAQLGGAVGTVLARVRLHRRRSVPWRWGRLLLIHGVPRLTCMPHACK